MSPSSARMISATSAVTGNVHRLAMDERRARQGGTDVRTTALRERAVR